MFIIRILTLVIFLTLLLVVDEKKFTHAFLEQAIVANDYVFPPNSDPSRGYFAVFQRSAFAHTQIQLTIGCDHPTNDFSYQINYVVRSSPCDKEFFTVFMRNASDSNPYTQEYFNHPEYMYFAAADYKRVHILRRTDPYNTQCGQPIPLPRSQTAKGFQELEVIPVPLAAAAVDDQGNDQRRRRRDDKAASSIGGNDSFSLTSEKFHPVIDVPVDSIYLLIVRIAPATTLPAGSDPINVTLRVEWKSAYGYLSAIDWPLLPFYGVMCGIYVVFALAWLVMSALQWRDMLRVQYWIGAVIVLGMLEKAVFYVEYQTMNSRGVSMEGAIQFAEIVSCLKKTLARMLVIIVSVGFGVVKPRLGSTLHKVVGVGFVYFILCSIEAVVRVSKVQHDSQKQKQLVALPLTLLEVGICWWIFTSLVNTMRALRLRRNEVKLSLYRHFMNTLIFAVLASVAFMAWSLIMHTFTACLKDWTELWIDLAFWHILFSVILLVIMILWRPTNNNQRYAFSPLLDNDDDEEDEDTLFSGAFTATDAMKLRQTGGQPTKAESRRSRDKDKNLEDELKWVDEHIPSSLADKALPALVDSDEELQHTKFEISKMQ